MKTLSLAALLAALPSLALAADLPIPAKAPVYAPAPAVVPSNSGFYVGLNFLGSATTQELRSPGGIFSSIIGGGQSVGGNIGYQYWNAAGIFLALELSADYDLQRSSNIGMANANTTWRFMELVKLGAGLGGLLGLQAQAPASGSQAPAPIPVPAGFSAANAAPYLQFGAVERISQACLVGCVQGTANGWAVGAGIDLVVASHINLDVSYLYIDYTSNASLGGPAVALNTPNEQLGKLSVNWKF